MIVRLTKTILPTVLLLSGAPVLAADYVSTVNGTNPLAYWRLDAANQASTNGLYATTYTNVATTSPGGGAPIVADPANRAASFDGVGSDSIITTGLSGMVPAKGSINAWINLSSFASAAGRTFYIAGESQVGNDFDFQIDADNQLRFYTGSGENTAASLGTSPLGQWLMVTASYDATLGASSYRNVYVNGVLAGSYIGAVATGAKSSQFTIGYSTVFGNREFSGLIDEVGVWNRGLSTSEVGALYASRLTPATPGAVPEPATWAMMIGGFGLVGASMRQRRRKVSITFA